MVTPGELIMARDKEIAALKAENAKLREALWPLAQIHDKCIEIQDKITGEGSVARARKAMKEK